MEHLPVPAKPTILTRQDAKDFVAVVKRARRAFGNVYDFSCMPHSKILAQKVAQKECPSISVTDLDSALKNLWFDTHLPFIDVYATTGKDNERHVPESATRLSFSKTIGLTKTKKFFSILGLAATGVAALGAILTTTFTAFDMPPTWQAVTLITGNAAAAATGVYVAGKSIISNWRKAKAAHLDKIAAGLEVAIKNVLPKPEQATAPEPK